MPKNNFSEIESLGNLKKIMASLDVTRLIVKKLSPNDNSKNQIYLGHDFQSLNIIPFRSITADTTLDSSGSKRDRFKAPVDLLWADAEGRLCPAPDAQMILYPKYPEVRMSGFLNGCDFAPAEHLRSRLEGRLLFLGIRANGQIIGHVTGPDNPASRELHAQKNLEQIGVFLALPLEGQAKDTKRKLITALRDVHLEGWIDSVILRNGELIPYSASNGGGYTLEAKLGVIPNGISEPDFLGWEIKQHGVTALDKPHSGSPVTLFTPEPTAGIYKDKGVEFFIRKFGYADKNGKPDRLNFGGIYRYGCKVASTGLTLQLVGYNCETRKIENPDGGITLLSQDGEPAAIWLYADLMRHWNRKHLQAAYIPSLSRIEPSRQYRYGNIIELGKGTDFLKVLEAITKGIVYYDPGIKLENASTSRPKTKRRSQFRIKSAELKGLYHEMELVDVMGE